jgi:hypothetical protein
MRKALYFLLAILFVSTAAYPQGVGIPSKKGGIGFGNLQKFTGIRFNFKDRNVEKINGVNVTVWQAKNDADQTGVMNGLSIGLPMSMGHQTQNGVSVGLFGVAATRRLNGINIGGLGIGAGEDVTGFNFGGLGIGSGQNLTGINIAGLGAGAGGNVRGFNFGGLGIGAGGNLSGFNFGGLGVGSGGDVSGISLAGAGIGAGQNLTGFTVALVGIGAGEKVRGITVAGIGIGAGEELKGLTIAGVGAGSPKVTGITIAMAVGGVDVKGIMIAPAFFRVGGGDHQNDDGTVTSEDGVMTGLSVSAYNRIKGEQRGVALGIVNYTKRIKGVQFGVINIVRENPRGLRVLPIFNTKLGRS